MELNKACNNLNNIEQIDSELSNFVEVTKKYEGINTDNIELTVDNNKNQIYANISQVQYNSKSEFPSVGSEKLIYVDLAENSLWRFDKDSSQYVCVGRDYTQIQSKAFSTISDMVLELNSYSNTELKVATNLYIQSLDVPDFWVYSVEETNVQYVYTSDNDLISAINNNGSIQIGYYKISKLETEKIDLSDYYTKEETDNLVNNSKGITQLVGTQENPINLHTDTEIGQLYSVSGYIIKSSAVTMSNIPVSLFYRSSDGGGVIYGIHIDGSSYGTTSKCNGTIITFNISTGYMTNFIKFISLSRLNGSTPSSLLSIYAPTTSGTSGQILQSNGANTAPTWVDAPKGVKTLIGTEDSPIILSEDIENGESYLLSGYFKIHPTSSGTIYHFPKSDSGSFVQCIGIGEDTQGRKIIELHGWSISGMSPSTKEAYPRNGTYVERIYFSNSSSGYSSSGYVGLRQINYKNDINYIWAPTSGGKAGQILQSNGINAPTWIDMPSTTPTLEEQTIESASWTSLIGQSPYTYSATITLTTTLDTNSIVELINNQPTLFATYGFAIGSISGQVATIYSIGQPSTSVTLTVGVTG